MQLSKAILTSVKKDPAVSVPGEIQLGLPEKVLQFGTGVLLRGLPDYFIDKANKQNTFNGRVVVVKSTDTGGADAFDTQDGLYTICVRGIEDGKQVNEYIVNSSISRVLSAKGQWEQILEVARSPELEVVISNTTEMGIVMSNDRVTDTPPASFPGKLLAVLYERFKAFGGTAASGLVIIPTELIIDNGRQLKEIITRLAEQNELDAAFISWISEANHFCSSLVDRIVPGRLAGEDLEQTREWLGYRDDLMIMSEVFRLWAIEAADPKVQQVLSFAQVDPGVVIAPDIERFRELKLRLLNGTHTLSCGLACLAGFETVKEAMADPVFEAFVARLSKDELATVVVSSQISYEEACKFADSVIERFKNPFLDHKWLSISFAYTSKMLMRDVPLIKGFYGNESKGPAAIALGFAAYLLFMKSRKEGAQYVGTANGKTYVLNDDKAGILARKWEAYPATDKLVDAVLADSSLWNEDLTLIPGFAAEVKQQLQFLTESGAQAALQNIIKE
ncbi:tagaturonate reductase [Niabella drilacis]|uniref:Tagaturonate reductase n=1 Tax=Niabella drilacis (strain DSM 25811 / CCM 8410 / CCUG 62505 / LMG 26954 / E90) TaxID=1285928 RepID=A0A1G6SD10_NIADE|nr:tagaturonate reductase [Niabella drilacis]SDD14037.1 tagaturonate reductase [Niabella drilacis]